MAALEKSVPVRLPPRFIAAVLALIAGTAASGLAQSGHCDPYLQVSLDNPFGYRLRGDRCEGVYVQQVANTPLLVASFGRLNLPQSLGQSKSLPVEWTPIPLEVRLRAYSVKPRTYYQMDSRRPAGAASYAWSTDVLSALELTPRDIGVVAWTERVVGGSYRNVYVPVRIGVPIESWDGMYELLVLPGNELAEVFVGLTTVAADGGAQTVISKPTPLKYGYYPAGRSLRIPVGPISTPGTYVVEIAATLKAGGAVSYELWFVHAAAPQH
jgi:hypothetical protein